MTAIVRTAARASATATVDHAGLVLFELRLAMRSRWLGIASVAVAALATAVVLLGLSSFQQLGLGAASPAIAALVNLMLLVPPAVAVVAGSVTLGADRDGGFTDMLRAAGVTGTRIAVAKFAGVVAQSLCLVLAGYGAAAVALAGSVGAEAIPAYIALVVISLLTTASLAAAGVLVAGVAQRGAQPAVIGIAVWLGLALALDLVVFALVPLARPAIPVLFAILVVDPIEAGRVLSLLTLGADSALLGPLGSFVRITLGIGTTAACVMLVDILWIGLALLAAGRAISRRR